MKSGLIGATDWMLLGVQVAVFTAILARELLRGRDRNIFAMLFSLASLVLIQGQAIWLFSHFAWADAAYITHLYQVVTVEGALKANKLLAGGSLAFGAAFLLAVTLGGSSGAPPARLSRLQPPRVGVAPSGIFAALITLTAGMLLVTLLGGIGEVVDRPGRAVGGQTVLLIALSVGKLPLLRRLSLGERPAISECALFAATLLLLLFNSRFLTAFVLIQAILVFNYCCREVSRAALLRGGAALFAIFIVYGLYREYAWLTAAYGGGDLIFFMRENLTFAAAADWFYRANVEGFVGLAGILTFREMTGGIDHDLGLSNLYFLTLLVPHSLRMDTGGPFAQLVAALSSAYPYEGSVVPAGPEIAFANFGTAGVLLWGLLLGILAVRMHQWLRGSSLDATLPLVLGAVYSLLLIRGTFAAAIFFLIAEVVVFGVFSVARWFFRREHFDLHQQEVTG